MAKMNFGGVMEEVVTREEFPLEKAKEVLKNEVVAVLGYGIQGAAQAMNLRDNGISVIVGQRLESVSWDKALKDGWVPGKNLFDVVEAAKKATVIQYLLTDYAQMNMWTEIKPVLKKGDALYFSHGFSVTYADRTGVVPPDFVDVILVAPKGPGRKVRDLFMLGRGVNSSYAIYQDATGRAKERTIALGIAVGSGYLFETTFQKEVYSDLTGERGTLMGALAGILEAQYAILRKKGHSPSEAFNETVEELTESLMPLVGENGMDWMFANCSFTARRGALDWRHEFRKAVEPVFEKLYERVASGEETQVVIDVNKASDYHKKLQKELDEMGNSEFWQTGKAVRALRPKIK